VPHGLAPGHQDDRGDGDADQQPGPAATAGAAHALTAHHHAQAPWYRLAKPVIEQSMDSFALGAEHFHARGVVGMVGEIEGDIEPALGRDIAVT
jgi:hypothetical protein